MTPFHALTQDHLYVEALLPKSHSKIKNKNPRTISRHTEDLAKEIRRDMLSIILSVVDENKSFSFTSDMYRSRNLYSFIGLTVHFLDKDYKLRKLVLHADYFGARTHRAENILMALETLMEEAHLDGPDITRIILLDNASNNKKAMRLGAGDFIPLWCAIHTLQLSIKDAMKVKIGQIKVRQVVSKCRSVSNLVRRSEGNRDALKQACLQTNTDFILPIKPGATRWNSTEANLHSCLRLQPALNHLSFFDRSNTWSDCVPSVREFDVVEAVQKCLQPLKIATKMWEADRKASLHQIVKQLFNVKCELEDLSNSSPNVKMFARNLLKQVMKRFKNCGTTNKYYRIAHWLDPDTKGLILKEFGVFEKTVREIKEMCRKFDPTPDQEEGATPGVADSVDDENLSGVERLKKRRRISADITSQPLPVSSRIDIEVDRYLNMPEENCDDPLEWWRENKGSFVILRKLAAEILSIPASSASSERAFSAGTRVQSFPWNVRSLILFKSFQVCSSQRLRINPQTISDQMMINLNYEDVQDYKVTVGLTTEYTGELRRLVDIEFPYELEVDTTPPVHEDVDIELEDGLEVDSDDDSGSDDSGSENFSDGEEESESD